MRVAIGVAVVLAGCAGVSAQEADGETGLRKSGILSPPRAAPSTMLQKNEEALNRQNAMDRRMDVRTRRVIGSVCVGCGGGAERRRPGNRATDAAPSEEIPVADPAEAPLD